MDRYALVRSLRGRQKETEEDPLPVCLYTQEIITVANIVFSIETTSWRNSKFPRGYFHIPGRTGKILRTYQMILPKFHLILPKYFLFPPEEIGIPSGAIWEIPPRNRNVSESSERSEESGSALYSGEENDLGRALLQACYPSAH